MALTKENSNYIESICRPGRRLLGEALKQILTNTNVIALKSELKQIEISVLKSNKANIDIKIAKLNK